MCARGLAREVHFKCRRRVLPKTRLLQKGALARRAHESGPLATGFANNLSCKRGLAWEVRLVQASLDKARRVARKDLKRNLGCARGHLGGVPVREPWPCAFSPAGMGP